MVQSYFNQSFGSRAGIENGGADPEMRLPKIHLAVGKLVRALAGALQTIRESQRGRQLDERDRAIGPRD
jgi:hypothetical protein